MRYISVIIKKLKNYLFIKFIKFDISSIISIMSSHLIEISCFRRRNAIRANFRVADTSSAKENCGLVSLGDLIDQNDLSEVRRIHSLPLNGRLSDEELAKIVNRQNQCLIVVQVVYPEDMDVDANRNVLINGYSLSLFIPKDDYYGVTALLNEQGHYSPISKNNGDLVFPSDIINILRNIDGNNYNAATRIFSDFDKPVMDVDTRLKVLFGLL